MAGLGGMIFILWLISNQRIIAIGKKEWRTHLLYIYWLVVWNHGILWLSIQLGIIIIPTDFHSMIFQRGRSTISQIGRFECQNLGDLEAFHILPSGKQTYNKLLKRAIERVDLPIENGGFP